MKNQPSKQKTSACKFLLFSLVLFISWGGMLQAKTWCITVGSPQFNPSTLTQVHVGDTIKWVWKNGKHTTTSVSIPHGAVSWDHPIDNLSLADNFFSYVVKIPGTYTFKCKNDSKMTGYFQTVTTSGIEENKTPGFSFASFPNPAKDQITLRTQTALSEHGVITLVDGLGKTVLSLPVQLTEGQNDTELNIAGLAPGIYHAILSIDNKPKGSIRILKQ